MPTLSRIRCRAVLTVTLVAAAALMGALVVAAELSPIEGLSNSDGTRVYYRVTCPYPDGDGSSEVAFVAFDASRGGVRSISVEADESASGGIRIMAPFTAADGTEFTEDEGFDPCAHSTCLGITCDAEGYVVTQEYGGIYDYLAWDEPLTYPARGETDEMGYPRCTCRDPKNAMTADLDNALTIDPAGPTAEPDDPRCTEFTCGDSDTYYLLTMDGTVSGCQCCTRKLHSLSPSYDEWPSCGAVAPSVVSGSEFTQEQLLRFTHRAVGWTAAIRYYTTTCKQDGTRIAFSGYASASSDVHVFGAVVDSTTLGGIRIMAPFTAPDGTRYTAEEGFDPCAHSTCLGITCDDPAYVLTQEYSSVDDYAQWEEPLSFPAIGKSTNAGYPRCQCRAPNNAMTAQSTNKVTVSPDSPSALPSDPSCEQYACAVDAAENEQYYLIPQPSDPTGCQCCKRDLTSLTQISGVLADCGVASPFEKNDSPSTGGETQPGHVVVEGEKGMFGTVLYHYTTCGPSNQQLFFSTFRQSLSFRTTFEAKADSTTLGGIRIMAPFTAPDGTRYTAEEGFDPCAHSTCLGITCDDPAYVLTQEYDEITTFTSDGLPLSFPGNQEARSDGNPRCTCRRADDPTKIQTTAALTVAADGPAAEPDAAVCVGLSCADATENATLSTAYYLHSADGTRAGCQCCMRQPTALVAEDPTCRTEPPVQAPTTSTDAPSGDVGSDNGTVVQAAAQVEFLRHVTHACPAREIRGIDTSRLLAHMDGFTFQYRSAHGGNGDAVWKGSELAQVRTRSVGMLAGEGTVDGRVVRCCGAVDAEGEVRSNGRVC